MDFWLYMLLCSDRTIYVGHTDDLERRIAQHVSGECGGYTATRLPVRLLWAQAMATREEALEREMQIKRWSRPKKLALASQDWNALHLLSRSTEAKTRSPSTTCPR